MNLGFPGSQNHHYFTWIMNQVSVTQFDEYSWSGGEQAGKREKKWKGKERKRKKEQQYSTSFSTPRLHSHHHLWWQLACLPSRWHWQHQVPSHQEEKSAGEGKGVGGEFCGQSLAVTTMGMDGFLSLKVESSGISYLTQIQMSRPWPAGFQVKFQAHDSQLYWDAYCF